MTRRDDPSSRAMVSHHGIAPRDDAPGSTAESHCALPDAVIDQRGETASAVAEVRQTPLGLEFHSAGAWSDIGLRPLPGGGGSITLCDRSQGPGYVLCVPLHQAGRVQLDGEAVVPGRFYRMSHTSTITGDAPTRVQIRPLAISDRGLPPMPHGNG